jgi:hypothetical protein
MSTVRLHRAGAGMFTHLQHLKVNSFRSPGETGAFTIKLSAAPIRQEPDALIATCVHTQSCYIVARHIWLAPMLGLLVWFLEFSITLRCAPACCEACRTFAQELAFEWCLTRSQSARASASRARSCRTAFTPNAAASGCAFAQCFTGKLASS